MTLQAAQDSHARGRGTDSARRVVKHSIVIAGHRTSVSLEDAFWRALKDIAAMDGLSGDPSARRVIDWPEQWNHRRLDLSVWAGRRIRDVTPPDAEDRAVVSRMADVALAALRDAGGEQ